MAKITILHEIGGLFFSKSLGKDIKRSKEKVEDLINRHIAKLSKDIETNKRLLAGSGRHKGSLAENQFLLKEMKRYLRLIKNL